VAMRPGLKLEQVIEKEAQNRISNNVYLTRKSKQKGIDYFEFGVCTPRIIIGQNDPPLIKYICIDGVFSASAKREDHRLAIALPDRKEIADKFQEKRGGLIRRAENILVDSFGDQLIQIPKVQNGMNPIKEILLALHDLGEIPVSDLRARMDIARTEHYLRFLQDLKFVHRKGDVVYPGNELTKYDAADLDPGPKILKDVLLHGFRYLTENLKIYILTPYLELSSAYYLQSYYAEKLLKLDHREIARHYEDMYGRNRQKPAYQTYANLVEMRQAHILQGEHGIFSGFEAPFSHFSEEMAAKP